MEKDAITPEQQRLATVLGNAISHVTNEALLLAQYELVQEDHFAELSPLDADAFKARMDRVEQHLGGPPKFHIVLDGEQPPPSDNYPYAALKEAIAVFQRARKSVLRAHMFMTGSSMLKLDPGFMQLPDESEDAEMFVRHAQAAFWEHAEAAYIRLYSFWDRIGQVLDFAFFNIRKFDQNGFNAVMDRVAANAVPMDAKLKESGCWKRLRAFQNSEKEDGLKWLLPRRNLLIHSLHLHPVKGDVDGVFKSQFNHLDAAHREKLRPREAHGEAALLLGQLEKAGDLFPDVLDVVEFSPSRRRN